MGETQRSQTVSTKLERIAKLARERPGEALTTLAHHIDLEWLYEAYRRTRKDGATGIDGQTAEQYAEKLEENLFSLLGRVKSGTYRAPPIRRVHIPKGDGSQTRPIGVTTFEDKVLQRAVVMLLEAVYEQEFLPCSYGYRPGRSAQGALERLWKGLMNFEGGYVVEVDIVGFFDHLDHAHLREILHQRVRDGVVLRLLGKWLNAGVVEAGVTTRPEEGTPQGGVVSPLLSNVYLHEVVDKWFENEVKSRLTGQAFLLRFADDIVVVFQREDDARRVLAVLAKRFAKYGLTLHPEKTKLVEFRKPPRRPEGPGTGGDNGRETFDLLGFTHSWGVSRKGNWTVKRRTARDRFSRALRRLKEWCQKRRHEKIEDQARGVADKLRGHFSYFGIPGNAEALGRFRHEAVRIWRKWLDRRSNKANMTWKRMAQLLVHHPLPPARLPRRLARA